MKQNFHIYRSSAGSGKTYTLALNFIAISLKGGEYGYENYYKNILAITFTNKAASEMKDRVLFYLDQLSKKEDVDGVLDWLKNYTKFNEDTIFYRASIVYKHILHNYADLGISTIDRFMYKIVRTFSSELGLSHNFDVEMDNYKIIQPVVALLLSNISSSKDILSTTLVNFAIDKLEDGKSINIERDLEDFAQLLFKEDFYQYYQGKILKTRECIDLKRKLEKDQQRLKVDLVNLSSKSRRLFDKNNLDKEHFIRGTFYHHFTQKIVSNDDKKWMPSDTLLENIFNNKWYSAKQDIEIKNTIDQLKPKLISLVDDLKKILIEYYSVNSILNNIYSIALLNEIILGIKEFKKENNIEHISVFNKKVNDVVIKQPASFIYERIGERYNHYLIDEFQDTSLLQWQNILPLVTASLDKGKSILVGDGKQSIYRWRGGEVEQFFKLPHIFKGDNLIFKNEWENKMNFHYYINDLQVNYRSRKNIIKFNNTFFQSMQELLSPELRVIYDNVNQDTKQAKEGGYIHIDVFGDKENNFKELIIEKIVDEIKKITRLNEYLYKNIAILCNSSKSVSYVAENLLANNIPVISNEGLLLSNSDNVNLVIAILKFLQDKLDDIAKVLIVEYLYKSCLNGENLYELHLELKSTEGFQDILKRANIYFNIDKLLQEPLYDLVEQIIRIFKIQEDTYLVFFLDMVLTYSQKQGVSLSGFLIWWEERIHKESIIIPEDTNAVRVMTIHKSKGLAFDVVIIPFNWEDRKKSRSIWVDTSKHFNQKLSAALINFNEQLNFSYFKDNYLHEKEMSMLDSLNKLYVAMTRCRERLYIFSKTLPKNLNNYEKKQNLNAFLYKYTSNFPIVIGNSEMKNHSKQNLIKSFPVQKRKKLNWKEIISLKHSAEEIWDLEASNTKRDWGKLLHLVLSKINSIKDKEKVIKDMYALGKITKEDYQKLQLVIGNLLNNKEIKPFFTDEWNVRNEKEILMSNGKTYIPDRLLFSKNKDKIVIIDYKTGKESNNHKKQINQYAKALMLMYKSDIEKILIYTSENIKLVRI